MNTNMDGMFSTWTILSSLCERRGPVIGNYVIYNIIYGTGNSDTVSPTSLTPVTANDRE